MSDASMWGWDGGITLKPQTLWYGAIRCREDGGETNMEDLNTLTFELWSAVDDAAFSSICSPEPSWLCKENSWSSSLRKSVRRYRKYWVTGWFHLWLTVVRVHISTGCYSAQCLGSVSAVGIVLFSCRVSSLSRCRLQTHFLSLSPAVKVVHHSSHSFFSYLRFPIYAFLPT